MKKHGKINIRRLINLEEKDGVRKSIARIEKRINYLKSKMHDPNIPESRQIKYLRYHLRKLTTLRNVKGVSHNEK
jgi:hypothetical protein